jgi:hypothetical protein
LSFIGGEIGVSSVGIEYDAGTGLNVSGTIFDGPAGLGTTGINIGTANLSNISVTGSSFGVPGFTLATGIKFTTGTSDFVSTTGNVYQNTTSPFVGTISGTHNRISELGVACTYSASPTSSFVVSNGIVTHC